MLITKSLTLTLIKLLEGSSRLTCLMLLYLSRLRVKGRLCTFVETLRTLSLWHFMNKLRLPEDGDLQMEDALERFCGGVVGYGPFWEHVLGYWRESRESSERVLFVTYEDVKEEGAVELRRLAEFLECGFSEEEEEEGVVEKILKLTSFDSLRSMEVNRSGRLGIGVENKHFFREGVVGGWKKYLSNEMAERLDGIMKEKLFGTGLVL